MTPDSAIDTLAGHFGILDRFEDLSGQEQLTTRGTKEALLRAHGLVLDNDAMVVEALAEVRARETARVWPREMIVDANRCATLDLRAADKWQLRPEDDTQIAAEGPAGAKVDLPALAPGIHTLILHAKRQVEEVRLIAAPHAAPGIQNLTGQSRLWGVNTALYGLRSERNFGLGDFEDLARMAEAMAGQGAAFLGINPVHNLGWGDKETISPYSPSHRGFLNTAHIALDRVPGLAAGPLSKALLHRHRDDFARVKASDLIDYQGFNRHAKPLLQALYEAFHAEAGTAARNEFAAFRKAGGAALDDFALFEALSEEHGPDWRTWPEALQSPKTPETGRARVRLATRTGFHAWLQWVAHSQLGGAQAQAKGAGMALGLYLDLAVGSRRGGAETWCEAGTIARGVSIGAPPDHLSPGGQNWALAAFAPNRLAEDGYRAFRKVLQATMRHAGVLRIDHVLGMNRSFWLPDDGSPGGFVRQPLPSLLAVVAIEADRARTAVIGEDLGLVPEGFRDQINARGLYSYTVLQYEKDAKGRFRAPKALRPQSLACFGTHDTPTLSGFCAGRDIDWWQKLGWIGKRDAKAAHTRRRDEVRALASLDPGRPGTTPNTDLGGSVHRALAQSPVAMVSVQLDDLMAQDEAQNLPGTIDEHPNWRRRATIPVEHFGAWPGLTLTSKMMTIAGRGPLPSAP